MKIFIIGIAGKIGSRLAQRLIARGDEVDGLFRRDETLAEVLHRPAVSRKILELAVGETPIPEAVSSMERA